MADKRNAPISFPIKLANEVDRLFDELIHRPWGFSRETRSWNPTIDLYETADSFVLEADLPGVKAEDVKVEVHDGELVLQGGRTLVQNDSQGRFYTMERSSGYFVRRMTLPASINKETIVAEFKDGVLRVILPKVTSRKEPA
jgi:HSP20 family protein